MFTLEITLLTNHIQSACNLVQRVIEQGISRLVQALAVSSLEKRSLSNLIALCSLMRRRSIERGARLFFWDRMVGDVGTAQKYARGGSDWTLGKIFSVDGQTLE